jgi:hypothetical protein
MLSNLLPGLRELRAPLAAGYLWLVSWWMIVAPHFLDETKFTGPLRSAVSLVNASNVLGAGIFLSSAAYLIGSLSQGMLKGPLVHIISTVARNRLDRFALKKWPFISQRTYASAALLGREWASELTSRMENVPRERMLDKQYARVWYSIYWLSGHANKFTIVPVIDADQLTKQLIDELDLVETRLIGKQAELYSEIDRLQGEFEFRLAVIPPLLANVIILSIIWTPLWLLGSVLLAIYLTQAHKRKTEANDILMDSVFLTDEPPPTVQRLQRLVARLEE